tara:strand:- start:104 stop:346 length:243 start_codon:yes stop_codon:yes gene_type:complete
MFNYQTSKTKKRALIDHPRVGLLRSPSILKLKFIVATKSCSQFGATSHMTLADSGCLTTPCPNNDAIRECTQTGKAVPRE